MKRIRPTLAGVDPERADAFVRWRILAFRGTSRGYGHRPRLSLVWCHDINEATHLPCDVAWWEPADRAARLPDVGLGIEITSRLLDGLGDPRPVVALWSRPGPNEPADSDALWLAALRHGAAITGRPPPSLLVVTRRGWLCLPDGTSRTWQRLRASA